MQLFYYAEIPHGNKMTPKYIPGTIIYCDYGHYVLMEGISNSVPCFSALIHELIMYSFNMTIDVLRQTDT